MQISNKKELAARTLKVGKGRITFNVERLDDIKEAITKQDIKDLVKDKAIFVEDISGRKKIVKRKTRRRAGSVKIKVKTRKKDYMTMVRKLRPFASELREKSIINYEEYWQLRKEIRAKSFKSKANMKERVTQMVKERNE